MAKPQFSSKIVVKPLPEQTEPSQEQWAYAYTVTITKAGFRSQVIPVTSAPNGWYLAGNFIFGGLIGWFVVDPLNGHMYTLSPEAVAASMSSDSAHNNKATDGSISILLVQDVPANLRDKLTLVY